MKVLKNTFIDLKIKEDTDRRESREKKDARKRKN